MPINPQPDSPDSLEKETDVSAENAGGQDNRVPFSLPNGTRLYRVKLVGGPGDGTESICSHNTVISNGETYLRGADDRYYHQPKAGGRN